MANLDTLSAAQLAAGVAAGDFSATDVARASLEAIDAREPEVQAFLEVSADLALAAAAKTDAARAAALLAGRDYVLPDEVRSLAMVVLPHRPGSLYQVLSRFYALGVNLNKLESRPIPERNFEFMFYFDLETSVYAPQFTQLMGELPELCEEFTYLGSYSEVV